MRKAIISCIVFIGWFILLIWIITDHAFKERKKELQNYTVNVPYKIGSELSDSTIVVTYKVVIKDDTVHYWYGVNGIIRDSIMIIPGLRDTSFTAFRIIK